MKQGYLEQITTGALVFFRSIGAIQIFISKYFSHMENRDAISKTKQSSILFQSKIKELKTLVEDYSIWDEVYNKMQEESIDKPWFKENFSQRIIPKYDVDLVIIVNRNKKIIYEYGEGSNDILNDNKIMQSLNEDKYNEKSRVSGFKKLNGEIYMVSQWPIFKNAFKGEFQGLIIFGDKVTASVVESVSKKLGNDIFINYDNKFISNNEIIKEVKDNIEVINKNIKKTVYKFNDSKLIGSLPITDISGDDIGNMNIIQSREMGLSTQKLAQRNIFLAMILSVLVIIVLELRL